MIPASAAGCVAVPAAAPPLTPAASSASVLEEEGEEEEEDAPPTSPANPSLVGSADPIPSSCGCTPEVAVVSVAAAADAAGGGGGQFGTLHSKSCGGCGLVWVGVGWCGLM